MPSPIVNGTLESPGSQEQASQGGTGVDAALQVHSLRIRLRHAPINNPPSAILLQRSLFAGGSKGFREISRGASDVLKSARFPPFHSCFTFSSRVAVLSLAAGDGRDEHFVIYGKITNASWHAQLAGRWRVRSSDRLLPLGMTWLRPRGDTAFKAMKTTMRRWESASTLPR